MAAFLFAASPFPDDVIFIPMGVMRYSPVKTFISLFTGKFVLTLIVAYTTRSYAGFLALVSGGSLYASIAGVVVVILIAVVMMRVDWESVLAGGRKGLVRRILRRVLGGDSPSRKVSPNREEPDQRK